MEIKTGIIVIADISGYTQFIHQYNKSLLHAETIISALIDVIIKSSQHPLTVNKLEGDAVLFVGLIDEADKASMTMNILKQAEAFFDTFKLKQRELIASRICDCNACINLDKLQLKIVLHVGELLIKKIDRFEEIAGTEVIVAHRLLKNSIDSHEYILMTHDYYQHCGGLENKKPEFASEHIDDIGDVNIVFYREMPAEEAPLKKNKLKAMIYLFRLESHRLLRTLGLIKEKKYLHLPNKQ